MFTDLKKNPRTASLDTKHVLARKTQASSNTNTNGSQKAIKKNNFEEFFRILSFREDTPGSNGGMPVDIPVENGYTIASTAFRDAAICALNAADASMDTLTLDGETPVFIVVQNRHTETITASLEERTDEGTKTKWGRSLERVMSQEVSFSATVPGSLEKKNPSILSELTQLNQFQLPSATSSQKAVAEQWNATLKNRRPRTA